MPEPGERAAGGTPDPVNPAEPVRLHPSVSLHWRQLDGDWVVFDEASGGTHHLDRLSAYVLSTLEAGPVQPDQLVDELAQATSDSPASVLASVERIVRGLAAHGLIEARR